MNEFSIDDNIINENAENSRIYYMFKFRIRNFIIYKAL